jgi:hypothetical protein
MLCSHITLLVLRCSLMACLKVSERAARRLSMASKVSSILFATTCNPRVKLWNQVASCLLLCIARQVNFFENDQLFSLENAGRRGVHFGSKVRCSITVTSQPETTSIGLPRRWR